MDQKTQKSFREKLVQKKKEILETHAKTRRHGQEADPDGAQDVADMAASSSTKEFLFSLSSAEGSLLQLVDEALARLRDKRFGVCISCQDEMNPRRLEAVPWARHCLRCQEMQEQGLL
jgi:RNA polymerase-binding transcription factor